MNCLLVTVRLQQQSKKPQLMSKQNYILPGLELRGGGLN